MQGPQAVDSDVKLNTVMSASAGAQLAQRHCWRPNHADAPAEVLGGVDPYNTGPVPILDPAERPKRRSLDDMRELSEVIKSIRPPK
jgi:hypothetical protein